MEILSQRPSIESFVPLSEHQAQTPTSFFLGPPVLHLFSPSTTVIVSKAQLEEHTALRSLTNATPSDGSDATDVAIQHVDLFVNSRYLV
jgi:chloride channel, nucleotide-sensitive, 1A